MHSFKLTIIALSAMILTGCKKKAVEIHPAMGILEHPVPTFAAPDSVHMAMNWAFMDRYVNLLDDKTNHVSVWSLVNCNPGVSSKGYGIIVTRNKVSTPLPDIYHGNAPKAYYAADSGNLWLICGAIEDPVIHTERLYQLRFDEDNKASVIAAVDPYDMQQLLLERLGYSIEGDSITFYDDSTKLVTVGSTVTDMGGFDSEQPIWIGEQMRYAFEDDAVHVHFDPGVKFTTGLILHYEDMPTLSARVILGESGLTGLEALDVLDALDGLD